MKYIDFISERDYTLSSAIHNNELLDLNQDNIYYLETKYGKNNLHNIIKSNRSYKNRFNKILNLCTNCTKVDMFLDNGLSCLTCVKQLLYLSKIEETYAGLVERYIVELEALFENLDSNDEKNEIKKDIDNLYLIKNNAQKKSLDYLIQYRNKICTMRTRKLECYTLSEQINKFEQFTNTETKKDKNNYYFYFIVLVLLFLFVENFVL